MKQKRRVKRKKKSGSAKTRVRRQMRAGSRLHKSLLLLLLGITALAMSPVPFNDFIALDDDFFILSNPVVQEHQIMAAFTEQLWSAHYKPLVYLSWIFEHSLFGNSAFVFHLTNLIFHLLNTWLVYICFHRIAKFWAVSAPYAVPAAFFTALLFGVHPLHVESVAWAIERKDVMFAFFYLLGMRAYLDYLSERARKFVFLAAGFYLLSLMSKSMGVTLLAVVFLLDWAAGRRDWVAMLKEKWPLALVFLFAFFLYGFLYDPSPGSADNMAIGGQATVEEGIGYMLAVANLRLLFFLAHTLIPVELAFVYPREVFLEALGTGIYALFLVTALIAVIPFLVKKYGRIIIWGLAFFAITLFPILLREGAGTNFGSDRYTYLPGLGVLFMVSVLILSVFDRSAGKLTVGQVLLAAVAFVFSIGTFNQARKWGDSLSLYNQAIENYPRNWLAHLHRGELLKDDDPQQALADYNQSIAYNPERYRAYFSRGLLYLNAGEFAQAAQDFTRTIELRPRYWEAYVNRGNAYRSIGNNDLAIQDYSHVLSSRPRFVKALNNRGVAYLNKGQINLALQDFNEVLRLNPDYINGYINRAALYINNQVQQYEAALADYNRCLQLDPQNAHALYYRGYTLQQLGRYEEALQSVDAAIRLAPSNGSYHFARSRLLRIIGRLQESVTAARQAQSLGYQVPAEFLSTGR